MIQETKIYKGEDLYYLLKKKFECDYLDMCEPERIERFGFKLITLVFEQTAEAYYEYIFNILNKQLDDIADVTGRDLEQAEIDFLIYNIKLRLGDNKMFFINGYTTEVRLMFDAKSNKNKQVVKIFIKER